MPGFFQRGAQPPDDQPAHRRRIAKPDFGLGRMNVDIDLVTRHRDEQCRHRMSIARKQVAICPAQRTDQQSILHRPSVDEQILLVRHAAIEGRQRHDPGQMQPVAQAIDPQPVPVEIMAQQRRDPRRAIARLQRQNPPPVMIEREGDIGPRHRQSPYRIEARGIFRARAAQEFAAGRHLVEQSLDPHPGAGRKRCRPLARRNAMIDRQPPAPTSVIGAAISSPTLDRHLRHARDRRQRLAAKAEAGDILDPVVGQFRRRMTLDRQAHVVGAHPRSVVAHLDQLEPAGRQPDRNAPRARIERIFDQFLQCARGPFDHLARGDSIDELQGQPSY